MTLETSNIQPLVKQHFPQFSEPLLQEAIAEHGKLLSFPSGQIIMDYDSFIKEVPLVIKGSIKVMREGQEGNELLLYFLNAGETCSVSFTCCMMDKRSSIRTIAEDDTTLISLPIKYVDLWMNQFKSWRNFVMLSYDARIMELVQTLDSVAFHKLDQRLLSYLQKKAQANQSHTIHVTHQEIAYDLNASREAISRLLKQLEKAGHLSLERNKVELRA